jgi:hypothetical protein
MNRWISAGIVRVNKLWSATETSGALSSHIALDSGVLARDSALAGTFLECRKPLLRLDCPRLRGTILGALTPSGSIPAPALVSRLGARGALVATGVFVPLLSAWPELTTLSQ